MKTCVSLIKAITRVKELNIALEHATGVFGIDVKKRIWIPNVEYAKVT